MEPSIIQQGAEALILKKRDDVIKRRIKKSYRISEIDDKIRKSRTKSESKLLKKASELIKIPTVIRTDEKTKEIIMKFINGKKLSEYLNKFSLKKQKEICKKIGESVAKLHDKDIIHGDLTTSNMILSKKEVYFIDFGLGFISHKIEDKAVDLHLLKQALEARHFKNWKELVEKVFSSYKKSKDSEKVFIQLKAVEKRGRYKEK